MAVDDTRTMWAGQRAFRGLARGDAKELFKHLDAGLDPDVLLVGIMDEPTVSPPEVCIEPPGNASAADRIALIGDVFASSDVKAASGPSLEDPRFDLTRWAQTNRTPVQRGIQHAFAPLDEELGLVSFCSVPQRIGSFLVSLVLQLSSADYARHRGTGIADADGDPAVTPSLLDAVIDEYLAECSLALANPELSRFGVVNRAVPELMRSAGKRLMYSPGYQLQGMLDLYEVCNTISLLSYEGSAATGSLLVCPAGNEGFNLELAFKTPASLRDFRTVRKLLEISSDTTPLLCDASGVYALGSVAAPAKGRRGEASAATRKKETSASRQAEGAAPPAAYLGSDLYLIVFAGHHFWKLTQGGRVLMEVSFGQPRLPEERVDRTKFMHDVSKVFPTMKKRDLDRLWGLILEAANQQHGTMVVVSAGAEAEAARLAREGIAVDPKPMTPDLMRLVTAIDGAVLLDLKNVCHAIGLILDGRASNSGNPARGARYNSAIRYVASSDQPCLAAVISEDGMIDLVPSR